MDYSMSTTLPSHIALAGLVLANHCQRATPLLPRSMYGSYFVEVRKCFVFARWECDPLTGRARCTRVLHRLHAQDLAGCPPQQAAGSAPQV
jgi:hypothetical protein